MYCPNCGCRMVTVNRRGFSWRRGILGSMLFGNNGFLLGLIGHNDSVCECEYCGYTWTEEE